MPAPDPQGRFQKLFPLRPGSTSAGGELAGVAACRIPRSRKCGIDTPSTLFAQVATTTQADVCEFWQRLPSGNYLVYSGVLAALALNLRGLADPDAAITAQLAAYPRRVVKSAGA